MDERPLAGGQVNAAVLRVGDTVRRSAGPWSPTIARLLAHARESGLGWVPQHHGLDDEGREVLDFIPGTVAHGDPDWVRSEAILVEVAHALREWHNATTLFERRPDDIWCNPGRVPNEVICHNDFAPYNHVFRDGVFVGAIDFDTCSPGPRLWDLAWTAYRYVPLTPPGDALVADGEQADRSPFDAPTAGARLHSFLDAYGAIARESRAVPFAPVELLAVVPTRLDAMADWCATQSNPGHQRDGAMYRAHARWIETNPFSD